ncbi:glutamine amidotransferase [Thalassoroseus pseudoceratinae]|uniref:glutamine amidotransferase n=1 Tax=Thalassoroseus pseudoceratinae TaxID=2713176 RepID=UPI00141E20B3|nr:glutamine amidotransferase [Thalassoroseus pseudoceratinae]
MLPELPNYWGALEWRPFAITAVVVLGVLLLWSWTRTHVAGWVRIVGGLAKLLAIGLLAVILVEPMRSETKPRPGANGFVILADSSQSLTIHDPDQPTTRAEQLKSNLDNETDWQTDLAADFKLRRYEVAHRLRSVSDFSEIAFDGTESALSSALQSVAGRDSTRPTAGILLFTDGNATDLSETFQTTDMPPVYPVLQGDNESPRDISITRVTAAQTNFETAPVTIAAEIVSSGYAGKSITAQLLDERGRTLQEQLVRNVKDDHAFALRFQIKPSRRGVLFYTVRVFEKGEAEQFDNPEDSEEATLVNNTRLAMVDRSGGPYRVLYVTGRPNWEFKFLRRALDDEPEIELLGLVRIANKEPKFTFRERDNGSNQLFRGFDQNEETAEQYDEPVLVRLGIEDPEELRDGFPKVADDLFGYHALILDDLEADFFTQDQKSLIQQFVRQRGGGFLMLGGQESFVKGKYARTPIGELLPVYADRGVNESPEENYKLVLTREGWLEPWVRMRSTETEERKRLGSMPPFRTVNRVAAIKPGASVLSHVESASGAIHPALVVQPFGQGRSAAMLVGDLWRWQLTRKTEADTDLQKAWRQMMRWLVAEVPQRIEVSTRRKTNAPSQPIELRIKAFDERYRPLDNATVNVKVQTPNEETIDLAAEPMAALAGEYQLSFVSRQPGAYRATVQVKASDSSDVGQRETGWISEPAAQEFQTLKPNRAWLEQVARETGGEVVSADNLDDFVRDLPTRNIPLTETRIDPVWHNWPVFLCALGLLVTEWGLRRWKGLP